MKTLIIINTITIWIMFIYLLIRPFMSRLKFEIIKRWSDEKTCGIGVWKYRNPAGDCPNLGTRIIALCWRNEYQ